MRKAGIPFVAHEIRIGSVLPPPEIGNNDINGQFSWQSLFATVRGDNRESDLKGELGKIGFFWRKFAGTP